MTISNRKNVILNHEGQILALAGSSGLDTASDYARCVVDGAMNAIIRMEGAEKASAFAFGVADRVAGGLREPTPIFGGPVELPVPEIDAADSDDAEAAIEESRRQHTAGDRPEHSVMGLRLRRDHRDVCRVLRRARVAAMKPTNIINGEAFPADWRVTNSPTSGGYIIETPGGAAYDVANFATALFLRDCITTRSKSVDRDKRGARP